MDVVNVCTCQVDGSVPGMSCRIGGYYVKEGMVYRVENAQQRHGRGEKTMTRKEDEEHADDDAGVHRRRHVDGGGGDTHDGKKRRKEKASRLDAQREEEEKKKEEEVHKEKRTKREHKEKKKKEKKEKVPGEMQHQEEEEKGADEVEMSQKASHRQTEEASNGSSDVHGRAEVSGRNNSGNVAGVSDKEGDGGQRDELPTSSTQPPARKGAGLTPPDGSNEGLSWRASVARDDIKTGLYSQNEENTLKKAVCDFAMAKGLPTDDFSWVIRVGRGSKRDETWGLWNHVSKSLPQRTIKSVAAAGVRLLHPFANKGPWTNEEDLSLRALVESRGTKWTSIGSTLERTADSCRFRWREIKSKDSIVTGRWSEEEEEKLKEAVEKYGQPRSLKENKDQPIRRVVLDDINWEAVVSHVKTRTRLQCIAKWYHRLSPSMIQRGEWGSGDDRRMLKALWSLGACMEYQVPWAKLVAGRTSEQCRRRWRLMVKSVPGAKHLEFHDIVERLVDTFLPRLKDSSGAAPLEPHSNSSLE